MPFVTRAARDEAFSAGAGVKKKATRLASRRLVEYENSHSREENRRRRNRGGGAEGARGRGGPRVSGHGVLLGGAQVCLRVGESDFGGVHLGLRGGSLLGGGCVRELLLRLGERVLGLAGECVEIADPGRASGAAQEAMRARPAAWCLRWSVESRPESMVATRKSWE